MPADIIDGKMIAGQIRKELKTEVDELREKGIIPGLATVLVGEDPASQLYVGMKQKACEKIGIYSEQHTLPEDTPESVLLELIKELNNKQSINGILVQLPLPAGIDANKILLAIDPLKDVDGFHPVNIGRLSSKKTMKEIEEENIFLPCTPYGIIHLLKHTGVELGGMEAVVVGRSNIVGKPVAMLLLAENVTVTICHSRTKELGEVTERADILVAAIGKPGMITADMVKEGAIVIDVGSNKTEDGVVGDVDFESVKEKAKAITPVPGGVGPMTITMLLSNTVKSAKMASEKQ
ncbi:bifunctional methylenetetrahydrofolate dehydrogenase/methenyltetrahydrofolate cyclohydrolase FolD [Elusimicrobiota bacterium]